MESTLSFNVPVMASGGRYCIDLNTVDDSITERTERFRLFFDSITPAGSATEGDPAVLCVDIDDNDSKIYKTERDYTICSSIVQAWHLERIFDLAY